MIIPEWLETTNQSIATPIPTWIFRMRTWMKSSGGCLRGQSDSVYDKSTKSGEASAGSDMIWSELYNSQLRT